LRLNTTLGLYCILQYFTESDQPRGLVSEFLTTDHEVPGSIPGSHMGFFLEGEDPHGDHGLSSLVEFKFKAPPSTSY
jgi:hypothetical protein